MIGGLRAAYVVVAAVVMSGIATAEAKPILRIGLDLPLEVTLVLGTGDI
jgi:uncharacterized membrane protein YvlD (DUF360 family)